MAGTVEGGKKASVTTRERHGSNYYARIGRIGGQHGHTGGFAEDTERARLAGAKGGRASKRSRTKYLTKKRIRETLTACEDVDSLKKAHDELLENWGTAYNADFLEEFYAKRLSLIISWHLYDETKNA